MDLKNSFKSFLLNGGQFPAGEQSKVYVEHGGTRKNTTVFLPSATMVVLVSLIRRALTWKALF
tara:strand:- start:248 stop:436 length:189 start_codon:yes stop_codon:yes gene_type:complete